MLKTLKDRETPISFPVHCIPFQTTNKNKKRYFMIHKSNNNSVLILNPQADRADIKDAISERITKIQAITNYILADASNGEPTVSHETLFSAIWTVETLVQEIDLLQTTL